MTEPLSPYSRSFAHLLDDAVTIPGTRIGVGLDALVGLVPGVGDLLGSGLASTILVDAVRFRVPVPVLARMALNLILDALLGLVPFAGDLLDVAHRANRKNYRLLEAAVAKNPDPAAPTAGYLLAAGALVLGTLVFVVVVAILGLWLLWKLIVG